MGRVSFTDLPDEVIQTILAFADPSATLALERTARRFRDVANDPQLWKGYCYSSFHNWSGDYGFRHRLPDPSIEDWKRMYVSRDTSSRFARQALDDVVRNPLGRINRIEQIVRLGLDIKDDLINAFQQAPASENYLAQKYWAHIALGRVHRAIAIEQWIRLKDQEPTEDSFELALGAFDLFVLDERREGDMVDIFSKLDFYAKEIRRVHPEVDSLPPQAKATLVAKWLLGNSHIGISANHHYHSLDHMFLGVALHSPLRNSLPLISAVIYCAVARRFDLRATPCSFPFHVHAIVLAPPGFDLSGNSLPTGLTPDPLSDSTTLYLDPFHSSSPIPISVLTTQLAFIARRRGSQPFTATQTSAFLSAATPRDITIRAALNLQNAPQHSPPPPTIPLSPASAAYAASWALTLLPTHAVQLRQNTAQLFNQFVADFPHDLPLIEQHILKLTEHLPRAGQYHEYVRALRVEDVTPRDPKLRSDEQNRSVKFRVGQVFRHRMRGYLACITGWDMRCEMPDEWIVMNQVSRLNRGKGQPFYNVIADDTTTRYVAEDNVVLLSPSELADLNVETVFPIEIGRHFKRWNKENGSFVSNVVDEYPED